MRDYYEIRAGKSRKHMSMQRYIYDELWPLASELDRMECWGVVSRAISDITGFLSDNKEYFPNYPKHMEQWGAMKDVADCRRCSLRNPCLVRGRCYGR